MNEILISDDKSKLDVDMIHKFLTTSYWAKGRSVENVKKSIDNSICFGIYLDHKQIGFARIITDYIVFAYLMDVFILNEHRGKGYSKLLLNRLFDDDRFSGIKKWMLATKDAHLLYSRFGFEPVKRPERLMEKVVP
jgi:N-acetylglutamate synthase-like GNAT family acetyltransferase